MWRITEFGKQIQIGHKVKGAIMNISRHRSFVFIIFAALFFASMAESQAPQISSISTGTLTRSGRLRIFGSNFGNGGGASQVSIDGHSAIVTRWSASQITAYVPEFAGPGPVGVQVITPGGASNILPLTVMLRQQQGRVRWTFEADVNSLWFRPALAPDGTIYLHGSEGLVFALAPDGGLKWVQQVNWYPYVPPQAGPDREVYVGSIQTITAINPDGSERWQFTDNVTQGISVSAKPGTDGNIYAANDLGLGAYSLSPSGQLRWNNPGNPPLLWHGGSGAEMAFGPREPGDPLNQMYVVMNPQGQSSMLQAFRLSDGALQFSVPTGGTDPLNQNQTQPAVGPDGTIYITHLRGGGGIGWTLEAFNPANGQSLWYYNAWNTSGFSPPEVGPDGIVYYVASGSRLISFDPATMSERWNRFDATLLDHPAVSPNNEMIVLGGAISFGQQGFVRAYTTDGDLLWEVPMPGTSLPRWWPVHHPRFTNDGQTVYVSTTMLDSNPQDPHSFLFAIATGPDSITGLAGHPEANSFELFRNYPNPFNPGTTIEFALPHSDFVTLKIYNILGQEVRTLLSEKKEAGIHRLHFKADGLPGGMYFCRLHTASRVQTRKLTLIK